MAFSIPDDAKSLPHYHASSTRGQSVPRRASLPVPLSLKLCHQTATHGVPVNDEMFFWFRFSRHFAAVVNIPFFLRDHPSTAPLHVRRSQALIRRWI